MSLEMHGWIAALAPLLALGVFDRAPLDDARADLCPVATARYSIALGEGRGGDLGDGGCAAPGQRRQEEYRLDLAHDGAVALEMKARAFDPRLLLVDERGTVVAEGEDPHRGDGWRSQYIHVELHSGTYYLVASGGRGRYAVGAVPLVGELDEPPPPLAARHAD
jgi:hypothetical protein